MDKEQEDEHEPAVELVADDLDDVVGGKTTASILKTGRPGAVYEDPCQDGE